MNDNFEKQRYNLNLEKHLDLIQKEIKLNKQNESLVEKNPDQFLQLLHYTTLLHTDLKSKYIFRVDNQHHWNFKNQYSQLVEDFLNIKVDGESFSRQFISMNHAIDGNWPSSYKSLSSIPLNPESIDFKGWVVEISWCCAKFIYPANELKIKESELIKTEDELRNVIKDLFQNIEQYS